MSDQSQYQWIAGIFLVLFLTGAAHGTPDATTDPVTKVPGLLWIVPTGSSEKYDDNAGMVACSYSGEQVVLGYGAGIIELRNRQGDRTGRWQSSHGYYRVWSVAISRDGSRVVAVIHDPRQEHRAEVVYLDDHGRLIWQTTLEGPFGFVDISDNGSVVAVTDSGRSSFYDRTGNRTGTTVLEGMIWQMSLTGDGSSAVAGVIPRDFSGNLYVISNNSTVEWFSTTPVKQRAVAISDNGEYLAGSDQQQIRFFARNGSRIWKFNSSTTTTSLAISSGGDYIVAGSQYYLRYFNNAGTILWQYDDPVPATRSGVYFSNVAIAGNGEYVAAVSRDNKTLLFTSKGKLVEEFESPLWVSDMCLSGSGNAVVIGTDQEIRYFDTGINVPVDEPVPGVVTTAMTISPASFPTQRAQEPGFMVIAGICGGILAWVSMKRRL